MATARRSSTPSVQWLVHALVVGVVIALYAPILRADFVWDDKILFHDNAWFRENNNWLSLLIHGFSEWKDYFRPLGLALFVTEGKLFGAHPGPFHAVSLGLHIVNAVLVSRLAGRLAGGNVRAWTGPAAAAVYAFHPALV